MIKNVIGALLIGVSSFAQAFAPQSGTWVVTSEVNGKPGRGLAIDVQKDIFLMQMYAYESNGQPTFYSSVGTLVDNKVEAPVSRYVGGRYFGSGDRSGALDRSVGNMTIRFTSGITGFVKFPGESEVAISRYNFAYPFSQESLLGSWTFTSLGSLGAFLDVAPLTKYLGPTSTGNGLVATSSNLFACEHQTSGSLAGGVLCVKLNTSGQLLAAHFFVYSVNDGEGQSFIGSNQTPQLLMVRRVTTPAGSGTGIVYRDTEEPVLDESIIHRRISEVAQNPSLLK